VQQRKTILLAPSWRSRLLLRMMDVKEGRILIGGQDISKLRQSDLRSLIAYVPQVPALFHRTLRDNIAFARPHATDAEIRQAAQAAHVTEFADALPDGFDTMVGERGVKHAAWPVNGRSVTKIIGYGLFLIMDRSPAR
jgi:ABC-type transport system involved in Fe-S cluster assembly fused permease/ATPase subunit